MHKILLLSTSILSISATVAICPILDKATAQSGASLADIAEQLSTRRGSATAPEVNDHEAQSNTAKGEDSVTKALRESMSRIYPELIVDQTQSNAVSRDPLYSPHLRDISDSIQRGLHVHTRSQAGERSGVREDACPTAREWWDLGHETQACCGVDTSRYAALREDHNFKVCCVRRGEEELTEEEIACRHPDGTGWSGLYEYYFSTEIVELGSVDGSSQIAEKGEVAACLAEAAPLLKNRKNVNAGDLTVRVNFATMDQKQREELARDLCMHPAQFLKLMDPDPLEDPYQKNPAGHGTAGSQMLKAIPIWASYCPHAALLLSDESESSKLVNLDSSAYEDVGGRSEKSTDLALGYERGYRNDEAFCTNLNTQRQDVTSDTLKAAVDRFGKDTSKESKLAHVGYSCTMNGEVAVRLSPVVQGNSDQPALSRERAMAFLIAAGAYAPQLADQSERRSMYKRFEPLEYYRFSGKRFLGAAGVNEHGVQCRAVEGRDLADDKAHSDRWYTNQNPRFAAPMRAFASCPKGWVRWRGSHSENACGEEKLW